VSGSVVGVLGWVCNGPVCDGLVDDHRGLLWDRDSCERLWW
jgi:hypothetical protein